MLVGLGLPSAGWGTEAGVRSAHWDSCLILIPLRLTQISCFTPSLKCFSSVSDNCPDVGIGPLLQFSHPLSSVLVLQILLFFSHSFVLPPEFCEVPYILSHWSGTPVSSQLVFCMHFWVSRCISDVSMVRDVLHIYLFLHHLLLLQFFIS